MGFDVTLEGLHSGASEVTATFGGYTARLMVTVTDVLRVDLQPASVELTLNPPTPPTGGPSKSATITPTLVDKNENVISADRSALTWFIKDAEIVKEIVKWETNTDGSLKLNDDGSFTLTGIKPGTAELPVTATYKLNGKEYTPTTLLPVTVKEISGGG